MSCDSGEREPLLGNQSRQRTSSNYTGESSSSSSGRIEEEDMGMTVVIKKVAKKQLNACCSKDNLKTKFPISKWLPEYRYKKISFAWMKIKSLKLEFVFIFSQIKI
jgi:hypothetical protein